MTKMNFLQKLSKPLERSPFYCRPLCCFILVFLVGLFLILFNKAIFAVYVLIIVIYCAVTLIKSENSAVFVMFITLFLCLGAVCGIFAESDYRAVRGYDGQKITAVATVDKVICDEVYVSSYHATLKSINGEACDGQVIVEFGFQTDFEPFDTVELSGVAEDVRSSAVGTEKMNLISKNRVLEINEAEVISYSGDSKRGFMYRIYLMQEGIRARYDSVLEPGAAAYAKALFLGDTDGMSLRFQNDMSALGVTHILAVSGMHTSILAGIIIAICERIHMRRRLIAVFITAAAVLFMFIAGLSPSIVRSVIMLEMSLLPAFFGRKGDSITSLFCSAFLICIVSPEKVMSCSLLLSFASCLAIVVCIPALDRSTYSELYSARDGKHRRLFRYLRKFISAVGVSTVCGLVAAPLLALYFGRTSLISVPANLFAVPVSTASMVVMIPLLAFANVPYLGSALAYAFTFLYDITRGFASVLASVENTTVSLRYPFFVPIMILLAVMFLFIRMSGIRKRIAFIAPFAICAVIFASSLQIYTLAFSDRAEAVYMTSKTSEGFLIASGGDTMYVDLGIGGKGLARDGADLSEERYCAVELDGFMLTHYHSGHISVMKYMLLNYEIERIYLPEPITEKDKQVYENLLRVTEGCDVITYRRGESVAFGNTSLRTSEHTLLERSTHPVLTFELDLGDKQILWLGSSVTESALAYETESALCGAEAVILGHHGPKMKEFIKFYSSPPENIPIIGSPYTSEWSYGLEMTDALETDGDGLAYCVIN